jgi:hypothetical protein
MATKEEIIRTLLINEEPLWSSTMKRTITRGLVESLDPKDKCSILELEFFSHSEIREAVLRCLSKDEDIGKSKHYKALINKFLTLLNELKGKSCTAIGYCLSNLANSSSKQFKNKITIELLKNKYVSNRRRGYKLVKDSNPNKYLPLIQSCWEQHGDHEAVRLIIDHADLLYLQRQKNKLLKSIIGSLWLVARLYIALCRNSTESLDELKLIDGITYAYVVTKLGRSLSEEEAKELLINNTSDERIGLLIWCFGKQKLWNVLTPLTEKYSELYPFVSSGDNNLPAIYY